MLRRLAVLPAALIVALVLAAPAAAQQYAKDIGTDDVADTIACPAGSTSETVIPALTTAETRLPGPAVGGIAYVRVGVFAGSGCPVQAVFEVIPPPGAALATDVPAECAVGLLTAPSPCPIDTSPPPAFGGVTINDRRSGQATFYPVPDGETNTFYLYLPIRVSQPFATFQASAPASCDAGPCPPAQGNGRVQVAARFGSAAAQSRVLFTSVGLQTTQATPAPGGTTPTTPTTTTPTTPTVPAGPAPTPASTSPTASVASAVRRSTLRRGLRVRLGALPAGARLSVRLRARGRTVASTSRSRLTSPTLVVRLRASAAALRRLGSRRRTATLEVRVTPPGAATTTLVRRVVVR